MTTISVQTRLKQAVRDAYSSWRPAKGVLYVAQLPEAETPDTVQFTCVPDEFLSVLDEAGVLYSKQS
ncbi:hypothetical protein [Burkholderia sp. PAMC 26561]|uniref:hypothetical protein n=1 Tax=Burkholderia sp. PAMC 26561 TaxID=1795043 RepID=UPI000AA0D1A8|nr:hypothetical protein [Burkholderia sp. PAMC 26561]